jgi:hypothetical protein
VGGSATPLTKGDNHSFFFFLKKEVLNILNIFIFFKFNYF